MSRQPEIFHFLSRPLARVQQNKCLRAGLVPPCRASHSIPMQRLSLSTRDFVRRTSVFQAGTFLYPTLARRPVTFDGAKKTKPKPRSFRGERGFKRFRSFEESQKRYYAINSRTGLPFSVMEMGRPTGVIIVVAGSMPISVAIVAKKSGTITCLSTTLPPSSSVVP